MGLTIERLPELPCVFSRAFQLTNCSWRLLEHLIQQVHDADDGIGGLQAHPDLFGLFSGLVALALELLTFPTTIFLLSLGLEARSMQLFGFLGGRLVGRV